MYQNFKISKLTLLTGTDPIKFSSAPQQAATATAVGRERREPAAVATEAARSIGSLNHRSIKK